MFENKFMGFGVSDRRRLPDGFPQNLDTNPFLKSQCYSQSSDGLDLCKKLSEMGISCDMSIWSKPTFRVDPEDFGSRRALHGFYGFDQSLCGDSRSFDGFRSGSSVSLQNSDGVSPVDLRLLGGQDSVHSNGFEEMMALQKHRDLLLDNMNRPGKRLSPSIRRASLDNDAFQGSLMFERNRVSGALANMEGSGASYAESSVSLRDVAFKGSTMFEGKRDPRALSAMEIAGPSYGKMSPKTTCDLPLNLASMVNIYGSVSLMAKDQIGCRALQDLVDEGTFHDFKVIFLEIINNVAKLSMDQFGNYLVQKLFDVCDEEQRTLIVSLLTSNQMELIKICLNNYGTRVVQKMVETVKTKRQIDMVKSGLEPCFLALVKDLNGNHVIQACLNSLGPNDNKFVLEVATKYCADIATHRHGCCVLQCCVSNSAGEQRERLVDEIIKNALQLSQDPFGNYVVQYLIEQNVPSRKLLMQFRTHYAELATQKFSSHVVEKCLKHYPESRGEIVRELLSVPNFEYLLQHPFGNYVIQTALSKTKGRVHARLVEEVHRYGMLKSSPYCKKIFSKRILKK